MEAILLCVHGYTKNQQMGEKDWTGVVNDRLKRAVKLAEFFKKSRITTYLVLSGGVQNNGMVEADAIYEYTRKMFPELLNTVNDVILERESKNTEENVSEIMKWALKKNAAIVAISSKDHASRVINAWAYNKNAEHHLALVSPSEDSYSELGHDKRPIVIEPPFWAYEALEDIFKVPENRRASVRDAIKKAILEQ